jgi:hypothetical protein
VDPSSEQHDTDGTAGMTCNMGHLQFATMELDDTQNQLKHNMLK